jgi:hypothetical protein
MATASVVNFREFCRQLRQPHQETRMVAVKPIKSQMYRLMQQPIEEVIL